jgi:hypothetical protein
MNDKLSGNKLIDFIEKCAKKGFRKGVEDGLKNNGKLADHLYSRVNADWILVCDSNRLLDFLDQYKRGVVEATIASKDNRIVQLPKSCEKCKANDYCLINLVDSHGFYQIRHGPELAHC